MILAEPTLHCYLIIVFYSRCRAIISAPLLNHYLPIMNLRSRNNPMNRYHRSL